jgi:rhodanese-related sulfurtransferase
MSTQVRLLEPGEVKKRLGDSGEVALLDVREEGVFAKGHLYFAANCPASRLELRIPALVPRQTVPILLCDGGDGDGLAHDVARRLAEYGYTDISVLNGGVKGYAAAGHEVFTGINVPSKAFGEYVEHRYGTPRLTAAALKARRDAGEQIVVLDSRPFSEFHRMNIPGAVNCPGAELALRIHDLAPDPAATVVVNCAGRTRSIIGAQSLINAGVPNPVMALKDGTMGWHLAGFDLEQGADRQSPDPSPAARRVALERARRLADRIGVQRIDAQRLARFEAESDTNTLFVLDVRGPQEYAGGHRAGSRSAPGGQLVQATDHYVGVRGARLVLIDPLEVRALMTAGWLVQMGWRNVFVLSEPFAGAAVETGTPPPPEIKAKTRPAAAITPGELARRIAEGAVTVIDLATSLEYRAGHIPGAVFAQRMRLAQSVKTLQAEIVLTSPDGVLARLAAGDPAFAGAPPSVLAEGTAGWIAAGLPLTTGEERMLDADDDVWYRAYDRQTGVEDAMRDYLDWEVALIKQIEREGAIGFVPLPE